MELTELPQIIFSFIICFARLGTAIMILPGFGEAFVPARFRLIMALLLSYIIFPIVENHLPAVPQGDLLFFMIIFKEMAIGFFLGLIAKIIFTSLMAAGVIISFHSGLANALMFDPTNASQSGLLGGFLTAVGLTIIFATNMHHLFISALVESYTLLNMSTRFLGDMSQVIVNTVSSSFYLAAKMSAPFIVMSVILNSIMGLMGRLMPQMQAYFVLLPIQLALGFIILGLILPVIMEAFVALMDQTYGGLISG